MKKVFLTLLVALVTVSAGAVDLPHQGLGIQIGWAQPILRLNDPSNPSTAKDSLGNVLKLNGIKIGLTYDASYIAGFGSSMGINYTMAGGHTAWKRTSIIGDYPRQQTHTMYHEFEVFVDWQYKFELARETYIILYTGPTLQCGVAFNTRLEEQKPDLVTGNMNTELIYREDRYKQHEVGGIYGQRDYNYNDDLQRLNVTWGVGAGFQYKRYFVRGGYDFGLINPRRNPQFYNNTGIKLDPYTRGRLDQWSIKIGMYFWYEE